MGSFHRVYRGDGGFTIVESLVASVVAIMIITAVGSAMAASFRGSRVNAVAQEATALAVERLEFGRSLTWNEIAMSAIVAGAPMLSSDGLHLDGASAGVPSDEALVVDPGGLVPPSRPSRSTPRPTRSGSTSPMLAAGCGVSSPWSSGVSMARHTATRRRR